jgi:lycopene beta-cyclase
MSSIINELSDKMKKMPMNYDYIITGSGAAGLSLLYRILKDPVLNTKKILVIDQSEKKSNDRTWCYWEKGKGLFEPIVFHKWKKLDFLSTNFSKRLNLEQYSYKMIRGIDFYNHVLNFSKKFENITFKQESVQQIQIENNCAIVETEKSKYSAQYIFNSTTLFHPKITIENSLLQHFVGWVIQTKEPTFNSEIGTLMDFRVHQHHGDTFMYVLPTSKHEALIEYTLFSKEVLQKEQYQIELESYIKEVLKIESYEIVQKEFGVIPMSLAIFPRNPNSEKRIINIGTAGGFTKASSGYTFQFIQKNTEDIVNNLSKGKSPNPTISLREKMFQWYDRTLIEVLITQKMTGKDIFSIMFKKLSPESILAFLGNESSLIEDIKIMNSLPMKTFIMAGIKQLK